MSFLTYVGMGEWMDLKSEVKIGDVVCHKKSKYIVRHRDDEHRLAKIVDIRKKQGILCVIYDDGEFDYYDSVEKCPPLLLELQ